MTNEEADKMLVELSEHFHERVAPVSRYCDALLTWRDVMKDHNPELHEAIQTVCAHLGKSNLAARLVYGGQPLRTEKCPVHKGHWSGCVWHEKLEDYCACADGANVTGWLPGKDNAMTEPKPNLTWDEIIADVYEGGRKSGLCQAAKRLMAKAEGLEGKEPATALALSLLCMQVARLPADAPGALPTPPKLGQ